MGMRVFVRTCVSCSLKQLTTGQLDLVERPIHNSVETFVAFEVGKDEWPGAAHPATIAIHHFERSANVRRKVDLVDHQQIGPYDARPAFAGDFVSTGHVDDVDGSIRKVGTECRGQIIAATFNKDDIDMPEVRSRSAMASRFMEQSSRMAA